MSLPYGVDVTVPSVARMYDSLLGGRDNFPADREACAQLLERVPDLRDLAWGSRLFLRRAVHALAAEYGIRQFIELGSGLPAQVNVHEVAQRVDPASRVVYVDSDPIVRTIGGLLLESNENSAVLQADMRDVEGVFSSGQVQRLIDPGKPVAVLLVSVLQCIPDEDAPARLVAEVAGRLPAGSMMAVCQPVSGSAGLREFVTRVMDEQTRGHWGRMRERGDVDAFCAPLEMVDPGPVDVSLWRPGRVASPPPVSRTWEEYGGVGFVRR